MCACVRACVRACGRAGVRACVWLCLCVDIFHCIRGVDSVVDFERCRGGGVGGISLLRVHINSQIA